MSFARLLLPASLALLAACAQKPAQNVSLDLHSKCPIKLTAGQHVILTLPSNPTTGYRWLLQNPAPGVLKSLGPEVYSNPEDAGLVGGAGQSVWQFLAQTPGDGHLLLVYQQPWSPEVKPVQAFDCALTVK